MFIEMQLLIEAQIAQKEAFMNNDLKGQHKTYAESGLVPGQKDNFGVQPHNHRDGYSHNDGAHRAGGGLKDSQRGIRPGIKIHPKRMPVQAAPDHGDHK